MLIRPRFLEALRRLNPDVPAEYLQQALAEITSPKSNDALTENHRIHGYLVDDFRMTFIDSDGSEVNATIRLISAEPSENDWLAVNQVTLQTSERKRRFDVVLYCNGLPVSIIELKRAGSEAATVTGPTPSCRPTCASSRWRSASASSPSPPTASRQSTAPHSRR